MGKSAKKQHHPWSLSDLRDLCSILPKLEDADAAEQALVLISAQVEEEEVALIEPEGNDPIYWGFHGAAAGAVVGFGLEIGHGPSGLDTTGTRAVVVSESADPLPLIVEPADIGSRDDPPLYGWAAEEIRRRAEASQIRASLAEK
eukprot:s180_g45.t1